MTSTKLIMVEGIPGAGKSSTCQLLRRSLTAAGRPAVWWHEEQRGHPVYVFTDRESLQATLTDLGAGQSAAVLSRALDRWRAFVEDAARRDEVVLIDSCLYGYLTWTLFWYDVPVEEIFRYVAAVEEIVRPLDPHLIYLRQEDVSQTMAAVTDARGNGHRDLYVKRAEDSPHGKRRGLRGFDGLVAYWEGYRAVTAELFARSALDRLELSSAIGWPARRQRLLSFSGLAETPPWASTSADSPARTMGPRCVWRRTTCSPTTCPIVGIGCGLCRSVGRPSMSSRCRTASTSR